MSNERAQRWLEGLGYVVEPEPAWLEGRKPDFLCHGDPQLWVEVKTLDAPANHTLLGRAWNDLQTRCERLREVTGDLYVWLAETYDERDAKWLIGRLSTAAGMSGVDVVVLPNDAEYGSAVTIRYESRDGPIVQVGPRATSNIYPFYAGLEPRSWSEHARLHQQSGNNEETQCLRIFYPIKRPKLAARLFPSENPLRLHSIGGGEFVDNNTTGRIRDRITEANRQIRDGQRHVPVAGVCVIYHDSLEAVTDEMCLAAVVGDLTFQVKPGQNRLGPPLIGQNGALNHSKNHGISIVRYVRNNASVTTVLNPWAGYTVDCRRLGETFWSLEDDRWIKRAP